MEVLKQHVVLNLINSGRYSADLETGKIYSHIGKEPREMQPFHNAQGYLQYTIDIGFGVQIMVYGQGFVYLAKYKELFNPVLIIDHINGIKFDNRGVNLRCITESVNLIHKPNRKPNKTDIKRLRLPPDVKEAIKQDAIAGISYVKIAAKYHTTRQTVSTIVNVK